MMAWKSARRYTSAVVLGALLVVGCGGQPLPNKALELDTSVYPGEANNPFEFDVAVVSTGGVVHYWAVLEPYLGELREDGITATMWWSRDGTVEPGWPDGVRLESDVVERFVLGLDLAIDGTEPKDVKVTVTVFVDDEEIGDETGPDEERLLITLDGGPT
ncbi:MAG: hypothetical protein BMS9Abin07_1818 [Acidimicrobiia bacterium]|nr:MAG: hypothetical protein BMS9Abin07_1818 [Acidimicrobiia bacterium]